MPYFPGELTEPEGEEQGGLELGVHGPGAAQAWPRLGDVFPTPSSFRPPLSAIRSLSREKPRGFEVIPEKSP
jgi:hypothetical protein